MIILTEKKYTEILSKVKKVSILALKNIDIESLKACIDIISKLRDIVFFIGDNRDVVYFDNSIDNYFESPEWKEKTAKQIAIWRKQLKEINKDR